MISRRLVWPLAILGALVPAGCRDAMTPPLPTAEYGVVQSTPPILQQSTSAPALETYQMSFWVAKGKASSVAIRYQPTDGALAGDPFLQFDVPRDGLVAGAGGAALKRGDSVLVTMTVDPTNFAVDFEPSGMLFSSRSPAVLTFWYGHANLDLNGNGVVDGSDWNTLQRLSLWFAATATSGYRLFSRNDTSQLMVSGEVYHFSSYAVSW